MNTTEVVLEKEVRLDKPILVEGLPGLGLVGKLAADYMVKEPHFLAKLEKVGLDVTYVSAPDYKLSVTAEDYVEAEKILKKGLELAEKEFKKTGEISFERAQK